MAVYHFKLVPLTPIHVGTGEAITPEFYFVADGKLTRFNPAAVLRAMAPEDRARYTSLISGADTNMESALKLLRQQALRTENAWVYSVELGPESRTILSEAIERLDTRRGEVRPLMWNEIKRVAILPGSAIKGAMRTALLSAMVVNRAGKEAEWKERWQQRLPRAGTPANQPSRDSKDVSRLALELESEVLRRGQRNIEWDPFRFIKISDVTVPKEYVRVDRAHLHSQNNDHRAGGVQLHVERIISRSDEDNAPDLDLYLTIEKEEKNWHAGIAPYLASVPMEKHLMRCLRWHYYTRFFKEIQQFPAIYPSKVSEWMQEINKTEHGLIRLGRFSHFESLSVEELRRTLDRRGRWIVEGTSRTCCSPDTERKLPFGWAMLRLIARIQ